MLEKIIAIAAEYCEDEDLEITKTTRLLEDLEFSSMEMFSFISDVEDKCGVTISERDIKELETISDLVELVNKSK